jgi:hypothetical protein
MYDWCLAILLVVVFAHSRFNTPPTTRCSTTMGQFYFAELLYLAANLLLLVFISGIIATSPEVLKAISGNEERPFVAWIHGLSTPLAAALVMTSLLPHFPVISRIDEFLLTGFRKLGHIPVEVRRLAAALRDAKLEIAATAAEECTRYLDGRLESPQALRAFLKLNEPRQPEYIFNRVLYLALRLQRWEGDRRFSAALTQKYFRRGFDRIFQELDGIIKQASSFASIFPQPESGSTPIARSYGELRKTLLADCDGLHHEICDFLAQGIMQCARTRRERQAAMHDIGFLVSDVTPAIMTATKFVSSAAMIFIIFVAGFSIIGAALREYNLPVHVLFGIALLVSCVYGSATCCAILPKGLWDFANIDRLNMRPTIGYIVSGLLAIAAAAVISFILKSMLYFNFRQALYDTLFSSPWFGMSFVTAVMLAFLIDDFASNPASAPKGLRYWEALAGGVAQAIAAYYVVKGLLELRTLAPLPADIELPPGPPPLPFVCSMSFVIGALLGYQIPHWYRNRSGRSHTTPPPRMARDNAAVGSA